jgi:hypothetical protein
MDWIGNLMKDARKQLLEDAAKLITEDRNETHGDYSLEAERISDIWSAICSETITPSDVPLMMIGLKVARASAGRMNRDDFVDIAGYAALAWQLALDQGRGRA